MNIQSKEEILNERLSTIEVALKKLGLLPADIKNPEPEETYNVEIEDLRIELEYTFHAHVGSKKDRWRAVAAKALKLQHQVARKMIIAATEHVGGSICMFCIYREFTYGSNPCKKCNKQDEKRDKTVFPTEFRLRPEFR